MLLQSVGVQTDGTVRTTDTESAVHSCSQYRTGSQRRGLSARI